MREFVERLKYERKRRHINQKTLEEKAGLTSTSLSRIENEERAVTLQEAIALASALGKNLPEMLGMDRTEYKDVFATVARVPPTARRQFVTFLRIMADEIERLTV